MDKVTLYLTMLQLKDVLHSNQGLVEVPAYNGAERGVLKTELFKEAGLVAPEVSRPESDMSKAEVKPKEEYINVEQEDV